MSHFTKALEEGERSFKNKFGHEMWADLVKTGTSMKEQQSYLTQFAEKIRQAVAEDDVEWANGNKVTTQDQKPEMSEGEMLGYNQALTDFITHKREQLTKE